MESRLKEDNVEKEGIEVGGVIEEIEEEEADIETEGMVNEENEGKEVIEVVEEREGVGEEVMGKEEGIGKERRVREKERGRMWIRILGLHLATKRRSSSRFLKKNRVLLSVI